MGKLIFKLTNTSQCQLKEEEEKERPPHPNQSPRPLEPDSNSQSEESLDSLRKESTPIESEPVPQFISLPSLSTSPLRSSSSPVTLPRMPKRAESPKTHPTRCQKRRRTRQTYEGCYHRLRWCPPRNQRRSPQERQELILYSL